MSYKSRDGKVHQSTVLMGENGLPVDTIATISGSYVFLVGDQPLTYISGAAEVTLPVGFDLTPVTTAKPRYTGKYILLTASQDIYYIDRQSIDTINRTFTISTSDKAQVTPASIDLSAGWKVAEADIVNRVATTASAKIDSIEFRDLQFNMELDGDPITIIDGSGNELVLNPDGSFNIVTLNGNLESSQQDVITELQQANTQLNNIDLELEQSNLSLGTLVGRSQALDSYVTHELDESGSTTYIGKMKDDNTWILTRFAAAGQTTTITYANISNNATQTTFSLAWTARVTLNYTTIDNLTGV